MSTTVTTKPAVPARRSGLRAAVPGAARALYDAVATSRVEAVRLALCAGVTIALLVVAAADNGGYDSVAWLGGAIGLVVLATWSRLVFGRTLALGRFGHLALGGLGLYAAWSFASIAWATDQGAALIGADRTLLYLVLFWLFAGLEFTRRRLELSLVAYLLCIGGLAVAILAELAAGPAPQLLISGQLAAGLGYHNGTAALGTIGAAGSILVCCSRHQRPLTRAGLAAGAAACLELSLLAQSRGWLYTLPVIVVALLAIVPRRGRAVAWALIPTLAACATLPWIGHGWALADGSAAGEHQTVAAADVTTARAALIAVVLAGFVAWLVAQLQQRYLLSHRGRKVTRWLTRTAFALAAAGAGAAGVFLVASGKLTYGWDQFTTDAPFKPGVSRFSELGSGRYDFWRVAVHGFLRHPLGGLGQDNFAQTYLTARHTGEEPLWIHSLALRLLTHTGLVGALLFCAFLACALMACWRARRDGDRRLRLALAAALVPLVVWLVHGSIDWFWELPALSGAAFAFLGAAVALEPGRGTSTAAEDVGAIASWPVDARAYAVTNEPRRWLAAARMATSAAVLLTAAVALAALVPAYVGERALNEGRMLAASDPRAALSELSLASSFEPFNGAPYTVETGIELRADNAARALQVARSGLRRDSGDWVQWLEYGLAAGAARQPALEQRALGRARALDPREPLIALAQERARTGDPLTIREAAAMLAARDQARVKP